MIRVLALGNWPEATRRPTWVETDTTMTADDQSPAEPFELAGAARHSRPTRHEVPWDAGSARRCLVAAVVIGVLVDQARVTDPNGLAGTVAVVAALTALLVLARPKGWARLSAVSAIAMSPWLAVRSSPWVLGPDVIAVLGLTTLTVTGPSAVDTLQSLVRRLWSMVPSAFDTPSEVGSALRAGIPAGSPDHRRGIIRGIALALPVAAVLAALLASGDRFFASLLGDAGIGSALGHGVIAVMAGLVWFSLLVANRRVGQLSTPDPEHVAGNGNRSDRLGHVEIGVILGALTILLGVYVSSAIAAALSGRAYVERKTGLTYAEYARSGFFQLTAVVAIVVAVLLAVRSGVSRSTVRRRLLVLAVVVVLLTLGVVGVSVSRLQTYRSVYGLTMLRFSTTVFALWLGVVLVLTAMSMVLARVHSVFVSLVVVSCALTLTGVNASNPEAMVARENITRIGTLNADPSGFDGDYLADALSDDAVPTIADLLARVAGDERVALRALVCREDRADHGWSWNLSRARAESARRRVCPGR